MSLEIKELENSFNTGVINEMEYREALHSLKVRKKSEEFEEYFASLSLRDKISGLIIGVRECSIVLGSEVMSEVQREVRRRLYSFIHKE